MRTAKRTSARRNTVARVQAVFRHHQQAAVDSLSRLLRRPQAAVMSWSVIGIALVLPLSLFMVLHNLQSFTTGIEQSRRISLFMERGIDDGRLRDLGSRLADRPDIAGVEVISAGQALEEFQSLSGFGQALEGLEENPLPPVVELYPESMEIEDLTALVEALGALPGVDSVQYDQAWLQRFAGIMDVTRRMVWWLGLLLGAGIVLVIGNTVRLAIEERRTEIAVVKLVGGTDAFVARPFLYTGFWYGAGGGLVAWLLLQVSLLGLQGPVTRLAQLYGSSYSLAGPDVSGVLAIVLGSGLLGWVGAWLSVQRHIRAIEP